MQNPLFDQLFAPLAGNSRCLLQLADGTQVSADAFYTMVAQAGHVLRAAGVQAGDRVAVQVGKSPLALAVYGASVAVGAVFLPLNPAYTADELGYFLENATPRVFLCDPSRAESLGALTAQHGAQLLTLGPNGQGSFATLMADLPRSITPTPRGPQDLAAILYTSGTTGRSKGAMLTQQNLLSNASVLADLWRFTDSDVLLHALPIFHTHGLFVASNVALLTGGQMIFLAGFDAETVLRLLPKASVMMGVPTFYTRLLDDVRFDRALVGHIRLFVSGSAPLLAETHTEFFARTGHKILERYGMTETNMNTSNPYDGDRRAGTVGMPLPGVEVRITADNQPVAQGEVGLIEVRGPNVFAGYWQMSEKTREELRPDGWFLTGDLGQLDSDGYLSIVGRSKDLIITGGFNVYPKELELLLDACDGVQESAVIGLPHPDFGEAVFAVLTAQKGQDLNPDAILAAISSKLAKFKQPKGAVVVPDLPRNTMGKVQKNVLRNQFADRFKPAR